MAALVISAFATIATTPARAEGEQHFPVSIELSAREPVAIRALVITLDQRDALDIDGQMVAVFDDIDPRVRVAVIDEAEESLPGYRYLSAGRPEGVIADFSYPKCPHEELLCEQRVQMIFELTDPAVGEIVDVAGELVAMLYRNNPSSEIGAPVQVEGLDAGPSAPAPATVSAATPDRELTLDAQHPTVIEQMTIRLDPGATPEGAAGVVGAGRVRVQADDNDDERGFNVSVSTLDDGTLASLRVIGSDQTTFDLMSLPGCEAETKCELALAVAFRWDGDPASVMRVRWSLEAFVAGYGVDRLSDDATVNLTADRT
ncbi:MAG: hypothetical protein ACRD1H_10475, partial [Vicinamibacterales bacterium]